MFSIATVSQSNHLHNNCQSIKPLEQLSITAFNRKTFQRKRGKNNPSDNFYSILQMRWSLEDQTCLSCGKVVLAYNCKPNYNCYEWSGVVAEMTSGH